MNKWISIVILIMIPLGVFGQEQTLLQGRVDHGGFGGPAVKFTQIDEDFGVLVGGRGAWIINHGFTLGGGGYGLVNDIPVSGVGTDTTRYLDMGCGGLELGFVIRPMELVHFEFNTLIGAGALGRRDSFTDDFDEYDRDTESDAFFILEPSMNMELNVTRFFRITGGVSYRYTSGAEIMNIDDNALSGFSGVIVLKFGSF